MNYLSKKSGIILKKSWILVFSVLFSIMLILGKHVVNLPADPTTLDTTYIIDFHCFDILIFIMIFPLVYMISCLVLKFFNLLNGRVFVMNNKSRWYLIIVFTAILMFFWIPYLMSYRPGGIYFDTVDSLDMAMNRKALDNHNPVIYTLIWRFIFWISGAFKGNSEYAGLNLFTELQTLLVAFTHSVFLYWCYQKGMKLRYVITGLLFVGIYPLYPFYGISLWKDTIFSLVIFGYSLFLYHLFEEYKDDISLKNTIYYGGFTISIIFLRNNGIFITMFASLLIVIFCMKSRKKIAMKIGIASLCIILIGVIIQGPVFNKMGLNIDTKRESMGIPIQQVAYIIATDGNLDGVDMELIENIMPIESLKEKYDPVVVDNIKFDTNFDSAYFEENAEEFFKEYIRIVFKNPVKAVKAYLLATIGFWDVFESSPTAYICNFHFMNASYCMSDYFDYYFHYSFHNLVNPTRYLSAAIFAWLMIYAIFVSLHCKNYKGLVAIMPTLGLWLTIMVATPLAFSFRYTYALFLCTPLYVLTIMKSSKAD